mgnify:FL=1
MAGRGPAPKASRVRKSDEPVFDVLAESGEVHGPDLPDDALPEGEQWHPQTVRLWDALRRFPLLANEPELGWQFLIDTALMHHTMWTKGRWEFASEVRLRVAKYGATPEDRMRLKIKIEIPPSPPVAGTDGASVTSISSRRNRLSE